ncbi:N-acetyltransferase family protein [Kitasatospora sp. NPDC054768]|uniref:GNAT family N-acetyltransferase n=1 Tax=Kitasatospora sp. NBC_01519 TaxID=2903576 RepID=UPI002F90F8EE
MIDARIRRAGTCDAPVLTELRWDFTREDHGDAPVPLTEPALLDACRTWLHERLENESILAWVAEVDGSVCGHVFLHPVEKAPVPYPGPAMWGCVTEIYVTPAHRGHGLGHQLLDALRAYARDAGFETLVTWPSECSTRLYWRAGFVPPHELLELRFPEASPDDMAD